MKILLKNSLMTLTTESIQETKSILALLNGNMEIKSDRKKVTGKIKRCLICGETLKIGRKKLCGNPECTKQWHNLEQAKKRKTLKKHNSLERVEEILP